MELILKFSVFFPSLAVFLVSSVDFNQSVHTKHLLLEMLRSSHFRYVNPGISGSRSSWFATVLRRLLQLKHKFTNNSRENIKNKRLISPHTVLKQMGDQNPK